MLSSTTIVLSSVIPSANATPASEITLIVRPVTASPSTAATVQSGIPTTPISVVRTERRKANITNVARSAPIARLTQTFSSDA